MRPQDGTDSLDRRIRRMTPVSAPPNERPGVTELLKLLDGTLRRDARREPCKLVGPEGKELVIPESVFYLLERVAEVLSRGDSITIVPVGQELTTQQAANLLNVSRQYLVRLLDGGRIPFTKTGRHRRVRVDDVLTFKAQRDRDRLEKLDELSELSQRFGGYDELK